MSKFTTFVAQHTISVVVFVTSPHIQHNPNEMITLLEAIAQRHSVRQYTARPIENDKAAHLQRLIDACNSEAGLHIQLVRNEPNAFSGGLAKYGRFEGVANYLAIVGPKNAYTKMGYYGERIVLEAQRLGLNTCWVGLTYRKQTGRYVIGPDERLACVVAIGYGATQGVAHPQKRGVESYCKVSGEMPIWFRRGMEATLLAPTAVNQQKFEFSLSGNVVSAKTRPTLLRTYARLDLGIAKCHFEIGAGTENFVWA